MVAVNFRLVSSVWMLLALAGACLAARPAEDDAIVITRPERSLDQVEEIYRQIPPVVYTPPTDRWQFLPRTATALHVGNRGLRIVMLGDSIVNDNSRSGWETLLQARFPHCAITKITVVRGSTGSWWYKEAGRVRRYVIDNHPDLLIIGGISQKDDTESIRDVIRQARLGTSCDVLLMTGAFGYTDPRDDKQWQSQFDLHGKDYRARLFQLSREMKTGFLDMFGAWGQYVRDSRKELVWFKRDAVHANERGEQILGHILATYLTPGAPRPANRR